MFSRNYIRLSAVAVIDYRNTLDFWARSKVCHIVLHTIRKVIVEYKDHFFQNIVITEIF